MNGAWKKDSSSHLNDKESFIIYEKLPPEYDSRVMAMEVDERPTEDYTDIGGLDK